MKILVSLVAASLLSVPLAEATTITYTTVLRGLNEVPSNASPGIGSATVTIDDVLQTMTVDASFSGLVGTTTASHIHCCAPVGVNAMVATTVPTFPGFPLGVTSGSYLHTFDLTSASSYNPAFVTAHGGTVASAEAAFLAGLAGELTYLNIHTSTLPGGEIRGQLEAVAAVPEPASLVLLGTGLVSAGARHWRNRRRRANGV